MNKSQRIHLDVNSIDADKHIKIKLEQNVDSLEFLTMSIDTKDVYQDFNADYGVLVGRVIANGGIGIPNARVSIFIPLSDEDATDSEIASIYPYKTPRDKNGEGKRYNLLPRVAKKDPATGISSPKQPFGSFPIKEEVVTNVSFLNVYKKYYKYTALTNQAGDYMIFGVPVGTQTVHLSVDITDIGEFSMTPAAMVTNLGYSPNLFTDNNSKIKPSNDLNDLPHIETQEISVDIIPFWGDDEIFEIGITRQDFRIRSVLANTFVIFGSVFTDGDGAMWGDEKGNDTRRIEELFRARKNSHLTVGMASKRIGRVTEKIFYYPANISDADIDSGNVSDTGSDMLVLDPSEYSVYKRDGDFVFIINCNRNKIITDELGNKIPVANDSSVGVFTKFRGFVILEITEETIPMQFSSEIGNNTTVTPFRYRLKFPQHAPRNESFSKPGYSNANTYNAKWRKQHYTFSGGSFYSVAKFHGLTRNVNRSDVNQFDDDKPERLNEGFFIGDSINDGTSGTDNAFNNVGIIVNGSYGIDDNPEPDTSGFLYDNAAFEFPSNAKTNIGSSTNIPCFGANWMNFSIHLPQVGRMTEGWSNIRDVRVADHFTKQLEKNSSFNRHFFTSNTDPIGAGQFNTQFMARSDLNWTDFIYVDKEDIIALKKTLEKGGMTNVDGKTIGTTEGQYVLKGTYRNGTTGCPINGGKKDGIPTNSTDTRTYFYKGFDDADCIEFLDELGII
jgi:hypothetical protein